MRMILIGLALTGCDVGKDTGEEGVDCSADIKPSVVVSVVDADGSEILEAELTYSVDGGTEQPCDEYNTCGQETAGEFTITASAAGYMPASETLTVESDICHVITQWVDLVLLPEG